MAQAIQHRGRVESVEGDKVVVVVAQQTACAGCHARGVCGEKGKERRIEVVTPYAAEYAVGESVIVALMRPSMGFSSVVWGYVLPLVVLLAALFGAKTIGVEDGPAALTSIVAVALYYVAIYLMRNIFDKKIHFTIIKE
jgi:sigma-E factor negative regulatory protein RseC